MSLRDRLVVTGVEILERDGPAGLSLREITRRTGVSHGAPRRYFPTHNALLVAIAATGLADLVSELAPILTNVGEPPRQRLVSLGVSYVRFAARRPAMFELMFRHDLLEGAGSNLRETSLPLFEALARLVADATDGRDGARERALGLFTNVHGAAVLTAGRGLELVGGSSDIHDLLTRAVQAHLNAP